MKTQMGSRGVELLFL